MHEIISGDAFKIYAVCLTVLAALLFILGSITAVLRGIHKNPATPEDARGGACPDKLAPEVDRARRVHNNAAENIPAMALVGLVYVLAGATPACAGALMGVLTLSRILHAVTYFKALQPWRSVCHIVAYLTTFCMLGHTLKLVFAP